MGGHYGGDTTTHNILWVGYYFPTLFKDAHAYAWKWKLCQTIVGRETRPTILLQPINTIDPSL